MSTFLNKYGNRLLLALILLAATLLRFWHFSRIPFMHDEFSALFRTGYSSFHDLILYGVKLNDSHPAGVQVFLYYWIKLFGISEPVIKLPFAVFGVCSVFLIYKVGESWFGKTTGLLAAAFMATVQYTVFYSQLARPYSPGLFFTLLSVYYWTKVVFKDKLKKSNVVLFVLASAANAYIHAFTLFFLLVQMLTGFLFVKKNRFQVYILSAVAIAVLYLPHVPVFFAQLKRGDNGGWLGAPKPSFIIDFFEYLFQFSSGFLLLTLGIATYLSFRFYNTGKRKNRFRLIAIAWFLTTFLTAYLYSVLRTPVIQYSTLYFVTPFLLLFLFSFIREINLKVTATAVMLILISGSGVLIAKRQHFKIMYCQGFDQIPKKVLKNLEKYKTGKTAIILHAPDTRMFDYYFDKYGSKPDYFSFTKKVEFDSLNRWLQTVKPERILYGGADYPPLYVVETLKDDFPFVLEKQSWFNSVFYFLSKKKEDEKTMINVGIMEHGKRLNAGSKRFFRLRPEQKFSPALETAVDTLGLNRLSVLNAAATLSDTTVPDKSLLVFDLRRPDGKAFYWSAAPLKKFYKKTEKHQYTVHISKRLQSLGTIPPKTVLKIYIWKKDSVEMYLKDIRFYITRINPVENGLYEPVP